MRPHVEPSGHERSLGELFADLTHESAELIRKEIELAKVGLTESAEDMKSGLVSIAAGGAIVFAGAMILLLAAVRALDPLLPSPWMSPAIVGGSVVTIGFVALLVGRGRVRDADIVPRESVESLRDDKEMVQRHVSSDHH